MYVSCFLKNGNLYAFLLFWPKRSHSNFRGRHSEHTPGNQLQYKLYPLLCCQQVLQANNHGDVLLLLHEKIQVGDETISKCQFHNGSQ